MNKQSNLKNLRRMNESRGSNLNNQKIKIPDLYNKLFNHDFHPKYIYHYTAPLCLLFGVRLNFYRKDLSPLRVQKLGCSAVSASGITLVLKEKEYQNFILPELKGIGKDEYNVTKPVFYTRQNVLLFDYMLPDYFTTATFEFDGSVYEIF